MGAKEIMNAVHDSIYGFVVGDAFGVPVEFLSRERLKEHPLTVMVGYGSHKVPEGTWSDDTSMVLATLDSLAEKQTVDYEDIMMGFCDWYTKAKYTGTGRVFDIGITTATSLKNYMSSIIPAEECGQSDERSNGNGSLMRILPLALYFHKHNFSDEEETNIINKVSSMTHAHEVSKIGCKIYVDYIKELLNGKDKFEAYQTIVDKDYSRYYSSENLKKYDRILNSNIALLDEGEIKSTGYVVYSLEASLWSALTTNSYEESIEKAVNLGGDTDTIGAITGGITGTIYGKDKIPYDWISKIKNQDHLEKLCNDFSKTYNYGANSAEIKK